MAICLWVDQISPAKSLFSYLCEHNCSTSQEGQIIISQCVFDFCLSCFKTVILNEDMCHMLKPHPPFEFRKNDRNTGRSSFEFKILCGWQSLLCKNCLIFTFLKGSILLWDIFVLFGDIKERFVSQYLSSQNIKSRTFSCYNFKDLVSIQSFKFKDPLLTSETEDHKTTIVLTIILKHDNLHKNSFKNKKLYYSTCRIISKY